MEPPCSLGGGLCHNRFLRTWEVRWYNHLSAQADGESFTGDVAGLQHYLHTTLTTGARLLLVCSIPCRLVMSKTFLNHFLTSSNDNIASSSSVSRSLPPPDNNVLPVCVLLQGSPYRFDLSSGIEVMAERHEHFERVPERCVRRGLVPCLLLQAPLGARKALQ